MENLESRCLLTVVPVVGESPFLAGTSLGGEAIFAGYGEVFVFDVRTRRWFFSGLTSFPGNSGAAVSVEGKAIMVTDGYPTQLYGSDADILTPTALAPSSRPLPSDGAKVGRRHFRFSWSPTPGASRYDNVIDGVLSASVATAGYTPGNYFYSGPHSWQVFAHIGSSLLAGPIWNFTVD